MACQTDDSLFVEWSEKIQLHIWRKNWVHGCTTEKTELIFSTVSFIYSANIYPVPTVYQALLCDEEHDGEQSEKVATPTLESPGKICPRPANPASISTPAPLWSFWDTPQSTLSNSTFFSECTLWFSWSGWGLGIIFQSSPKVSEMYSHMPCWKVENLSPLFLPGFLPQRWFL